MQTAKILYKLLLSLQNNKILFKKSADKKATVETVALPLSHIFKRKVLNKNLRKNEGEPRKKSYLPNGTNYF